jgi:lipoprotein-releasing system permease protein
MSRSPSAVFTLAWRFLMTKSSEGFLSFIAWVSVIGVALGVLALTSVTSVINGFEGELVRIITGMNGDVVLYSRGEPVSEPEAVVAKVRALVPQVEATAASFVSEMMISGPSGVAGMVLEGVDRDSIGQVTSLPSRVLQGTFPTLADEVMLGEALATRIGAVVGTPIKLIAPFLGDEDSGVSAGGEPRVISAKVSGIFKMGMYDYDSKFVIARLVDVQRHLVQPGRVTTFKIKLKEGTDTRMVSDRLRDSFGFPFNAKDWGQLNRNLFYAIELEKAVIAIILTVIVVVAAFNVVSTLMMMIHDKTSEIAILKAMGFRQKSVFQIFCWTGMGIGAVGTVTGIALGLLTAWGIGNSRLIELPAEIYPVSYLPVLVRWSEVLLIGGVALMITFAATLYPSWMVARRSPLEGIRQE